MGAAFPSEKVCSVPNDGAVISKTFLNAEFRVRHITGRNRFFSFLKRTRSTDPARRIDVESLSSEMSYESFTDEDAKALYDQNTSNLVTYQLEGDLKRE